MEMIFLSPKKISMLQDALERYGQMKNSTYFAQAEMEKCVPMGDGCFHPQLGYMEKKESSKETVLFLEIWYCTPSLVKSS